MIGWLTYIAAVLVIKHLLWPTERAVPEAQVVRR